MHAFHVQSNQSEPMPRPLPLFDSHRASTPRTTIPLPYSPQITRDSLYVSESAKIFQGSISEACLPYLALPSWENHNKSYCSWFSSISFSLLTDPGASPWGPSSWELWITSHLSRVIVSWSVGSPYQNSNKNLHFKTHDMKEERWFRVRNRTNFFRSNNLGHPFIRQSFKAKMFPLGIKW